MADDRPVITPAQFGENLFARVFAPDALVRQIDRAITERELAIDLPDQPVPITPGVDVPLLRVSTSGVARIAPLGVRVLGPGRFDALVHVDIKPLTVTFNTGGVEMWDIEVDAALQVQVLLKQPLGVRVELGVPTGEQIQVTCLNANDSWGVSKGGVEEKIRAQLVDALTKAAAGSERDRTIDLEAQMRTAMNAPQPVQVVLGDADPTTPTGLMLGVNGAVVYRDADGDWVLRARAGVKNGSPAKVAFGRDRFALAGWTITSVHDGDFPTSIVLPPGASMEGELGFAVAGDRPPPRTCWFEVRGVGAVPWRREVPVAEAAAPPIRQAPWPPVGRIDCAATSPGFVWNDGSNDVVVSVFLVLRNQGYAPVSIPPGYFRAIGAGAAGTFYSGHATFSDGFLLGGQRQLPVLVSWYWRAGTKLGDRIDVLFGPDKNPQVKLGVALVAGEPICTR